MKNVQVIDGAINCSYSIFLFTEEEFKKIFPLPGQDVEFIEDVVKRMGEDGAGEVLRDVWNRPVDKKNVSGIHGILFYELENKRKFYPKKIESEMICTYIPE